MVTKEQQKLIDIARGGKPLGLTPIEKATGITFERGTGTVITTPSTSKRTSGRVSKVERAAKVEAAKKAAAEEAARKAAEAEAKKRAEAQKVLQKKRAADFLRQQQEARKRLRAKIQTEAAKRALLLVKKTGDIIKRQSETKIGKEVIRAADFVSGGKIEKKRLETDREEIQKDIIEFNKQFGKGELSESDFKKATTKLKLLEGREKRLKEQEEKFEKSTKKKIGELVWGKSQIELTSKDRKELLDNIREKEAKIKKRRAEGKGTKILESRLKSDIESLNRGYVPIIAGSPPPIIPAGIPLTSKPTNIKFIGKQTRQGNILKTDLLFTQNGKTIGVAKGATLVKGKTGYTLTKGIAGEQSIKFPTGKTKYTSIKSFVSKEAGRQEGLKLNVGQRLDLFREAKKVGTIDVINKNLDALTDLGIGQVSTIKGVKTLKTGIKFPSGKIVQKPVKIDKNTFASISAIFKKGDISKIVGKSITSKGAKADFSGIIIGSKDATKTLKGLSSAQKVQYQQALNKVLGATAAALSKADKLKGVTKAAKLVAASATIVPKTVTAKPTAPLKAITPRLKTITKQQVSTGIKQVNQVVPSLQKAATITQQRIKSTRKALTKAVQLQAPAEEKTKLRQKIKALQDTQTKVKQRVRQAQKAKQKLKQAQKTIQKQQLKSVQISKAAVPKVIRVPKIPALILPVPTKKKKTRKIRRVVRKKVQGYNVLARPVKKRKNQKKPKPVKVNKVPLRKTRAKNLRNYITDTSLSRTADLKKTNRKPKKPVLKVPAGYAKRTKNKFRTYKIVKGKRVPLKKGRVIEKRTKLLDTRQEKNKITLRKRLKQLEKRSIKKKKVKGGIKKNAIKKKEKNNKRTSSRTKKNRRK